MTKTDNPLHHKEREIGRKKNTHSYWGEEGDGAVAVGAVKGKGREGKAEKAWMNHTARTAAAEVAVSWST